MCGVGAKSVAHLMKLHLLQWELSENCQLYKGPNNVEIEKIMSKRKIMHVLYLHLAWPNYGLDVLNITMHTEVVIHSMNAVVNV